jgi:MbtH protein
MADEPLRARPEGGHRLFTVLVNSEGQHGLWPEAARVPEGWQIVFGPADEAECLTFVEISWTDMRPLSVIEQEKCELVRRPVWSATEES